MLNKREVVAGMAVIGVASGATGASPASAQNLSGEGLFTGKRPAPEARKFSSPAIEAHVNQLTSAIRDTQLAALFENCFPNTLDTTVERVGTFDAGPSAFIITGDIDAMWLRDSSAQVWPYIRFAKDDDALQTLFRGIIQQQARFILIDPYANAFMPDITQTTNLLWAQNDYTDMVKGVAERKWEVDSLCWTIRLAHGYWKTSGDTAPFDTVVWQPAMRRVLQTLQEQQRKVSDGPYHFQRKAANPVDTLLLNGYGAPTQKVGLIHSGFRPSDDACTYPFLIPSNHFAVVSLRQLSEMATAFGMGAGFAIECRALADEVATALIIHGKARLPSGTTVWAYEVDGYGNTLFMDDANTPSLLSLPYLGACSRQDPLYQATRKAVLSLQNPYFFKGIAAEGTGGPHIGKNMIWPMSIMMRALTSDDDAEIMACLAELKTTTAGTGFMHEAFHKDDPTKFTRSWFAWANTLFGELILDIATRKPKLIL